MAERLMPQERLGALRASAREGPVPESALLDHVEALEAIERKLVKALGDVFLTGNTSVAKRALQEREAYRNIVQVVAS